MTKLIKEFLFNFNKKNIISIKFILWKKNSRNVVILDRDGVINEHIKPYVINYKKFRLIKNSLRGIYKLNKKKFLIAIATNQSWVGRRIVSKKVIEKIHFQFLKNLKKIGIKIYEFAVCCHHPLQNYECRKPKTGLITDILNKKQYSINQKWFVGDNIIDLIADGRIPPQ